MREQREGAPGEKGAHSVKFQAGWPSSSLADVPGLDTMTDRAQHIAMEYWRSGYTFGWQAGYAAAEAAQAELDRRAAESVRVAARGTDYATLCERRGEPERAEAQRRTLAERGIA